MKQRKVLAADLFCGAGGSSTGLRLACQQRGMKLELLAINHWDTAIETHSTNHPDARHLCMNVDQVDPHKAVPGGKLDILIASPECTHHSIARGGKPINDQSRASAWLVLRWCEALEIKNVLIENVPEFMSWGPLGTNGRPLKTKKGKTFLAFIAALESLGYAVKYRVLNAADYGDPTTRKRLFILARKGRRRVVFPEPTHSPDGKADMFGKRKKWRAAKEIINWDLQGNSIFTRKKPLSPNTMKRIFAGLEKFSGGAFVMATGGPTGQNHGYLRGASVNEPVQVITTKPAMALVEPFLVSFHGGNGHEKRTHSVEQPVPTVDTSNRYGVAEPFLTEFHGAGVGVQPISKPLPTQTTKDRFGLVEPLAVKSADGQTYLLDIRFRMLTPHELALAMSFPENYKFAGNREKVVKQIGNAVAVNVAKALCGALLD
jgi:DNA (cytosine-5)-methyltransferase 1